MSRRRPGAGVGTLAVASGFGTVKQTFDGALAPFRRGVVPIWRSVLIRTLLNCRGCQSLVDIVVHPDRLVLTGVPQLENLPARDKIPTFTPVQCSPCSTRCQRSRDRVNAPTAVHSETFRSVVSRGAFSGGASEPVGASRCIASRAPGRDGVLGGLGGDPGAVRRAGRGDADAGTGHRREPVRSLTSLRGSFRPAPPAWPGDYERGRASARRGARRSGLRGLAGVAALPVKLSMPRFLSR